MKTVSLSPPVSPGWRTMEALLAAGLVVGLATLFFVRPEQLTMLSCPFKEITGYSCFTCGLTHSLHAMAHGELWTSFRYHVMGPVLFLGGMAAIALFTYEAATGRSFPFRPGPLTQKRLIRGLVATWGLFWLVRLAVEMHLVSCR